MNSERIITLLFLISLVVFNIWMIGFGKQPWVISSLNIFFHEAGHWIFSFFGRFIYVLGGTLGELLTPSLFIGYFILHRNIAGQAFSWWWLSTALYDVSIYVSDARSQSLSLIGGPGGHDWFYLLGRMRLLDYDIFIGRIFIFLSLLVTAYVVWLTYRYWILSQGRIIE